MLGALRSLLLSRRRAKALKSVVDSDFRALLSAPKFDYQLSWRQHEYLAVDIETTGLDPLKDEVVSFGWVPIVDARIQVQQAHRCLVRTNADIESSATVHGLRQQDLAQGISLDEALLKLIIALNDRILLVHYQGLDKVLLDRLCEQRYGSRLWVPMVDTLEVARCKLRHETMKADGFRLMALCERFGLPSVRQHDALNDAFATAQLFLALISHERQSLEPSLAELVQ